MTEEEKEFQRRCDNFAAVEEVAARAAMEKISETSPDFTPTERGDELIAALIAGAWRTYLIMNEMLNTGLPLEHIRDNFISGRVTRILRRSPELPETKPS